MATHEYSSSKFVTVQELQNIRKSNDLSNTPLMERKFTQQELRIREAKVDKGINLLTALQISVPFLGKPFY